MVLSRAQFLFDAYESQTAFHEFWFCAYRLMLEFSHTVPLKSPAKFLESFGWVPPTYCHPDSKHVHRRSKCFILARFWDYPYTYHMGTSKIA